jgi:hypothetical protein
MKLNVSDHEKFRGNDPDKLCPRFRFVIPIFMVPPSFIESTITLPQNLLDAIVVPAVSARESPNNGS